MNGIEVNGRFLATDEDGYIENLDDWSPAVGEKMASVDGIVLTASHWEVINFVREYYREYQLAPPMRVLTRAIGKRLGPEKGNSPYLYELFPSGPAKQACRYGGLPKPTNCV